MSYENQPADHRSTRAECAASGFTHRRPVADSMAAILVVCLLMISPGCRICSTCEMEDYSAYGGAWQRTQRDGGRVGSVFDPAGVRQASLTSKDAPPSAAALERKRLQSLADAEKESQDRRSDRADEAGSGDEAGGDDSGTDDAENDFDEPDQDVIETTSLPPLPRL